MNFRRFFSPLPLYRSLFVHRVAIFDAIQCRSTVHQHRQRCLARHFFFPHFEFGSIVFFSLAIRICSIWKENNHFFTSFANKENFFPFLFNCFPLASIAQKKNRLHSTPKKKFVRFFFRIRFMRNRNDFGNAIRRGWFALQRVRSERTQRWCAFDAKKEKLEWTNPSAEDEVPSHRRANNAPAETWSRARASSSDANVREVLGPNNRRNEFKVEIPVINSTRREHGNWETEANGECMLLQRRNAVQSISEHMRIVNGCDTRPSYAPIERYANITLFADHLILDALQSMVYALHS